jgi:hypothetical protein
MFNRKRRFQAVQKEMARCCQQSTWECRQLTISLHRNDTDRQTDTQGRVLSYPYCWRGKVMFVLRQKDVQSNNYLLHIRKLFYKRDRKCLQVKLKSSF